MGIYPIVYHKAGKKESPRRRAGDRRQRFRKKSPTRRVMDMDAMASMSLGTSLEREPPGSGKGSRAVTGSAIRSPILGDPDSHASVRTGSE